MPDNLYQVVLDYGGIGVDVRVNDGPIWLKRSRRSGTFEIPMNPWLCSGANTFAYRFYPYPDERQLNPGFYARVTVYERVLNQPKESRRAVASAEYTSEGLRSLTSTPDGGVLATLDFNADVSFPPWTWVSAPVIASTPQTLAALLGELDAIHVLLARRNAVAVAARVRERDRELAVSNYEPAETQFAETLRDYTAMASDANMPLEPRETKNLVLRLYGEGRLARVEDENGASPIYFLSLDESIVRYVPFIFCQKADQSWLVIR